MDGAQSYVLPVACLVQRLDDCHWMTRISKDSTGAFYDDWQNNLFRSIARVDYPSRRLQLAAWLWLVQRLFDSRIWFMPLGIWTGPLSRLGKKNFADIMLNGESPADFFRYRVCFRGQFWRLAIAARFIGFATGCSRLVCRQADVESSECVRVSMWRTGRGLCYPFIAHWPILFLVAGGVIFTSVWRETRRRARLRVVVNSWHRAACGRQLV